MLKHSDGRVTGSTAGPDAMSMRSGTSPTVRRYLVVANGTSGGTGLAGVIRARAMEEGAFRVVVPTPPDDGREMAEAQRRLDRTVGRIRSEGYQVSGSVAAADPFEAIRDEITSEHYEGVIMSTPPAGVSRWLHRDLPHRVEKEFQIPVEWVESSTDDPDEPTTPQIALPW